MSGRIRLRRRAGAPAQESPPADVRCSERGRVDRRSTPAGGGSECMSGPGRLTPAPWSRARASRQRRSDPDGWPAGKDADTGAVALNILQRYVIFEVVRAFSLALLTMSAIFVLFMVAAQARDIGLSPQRHRRAGPLRHPQHAALHDPRLAPLRRDGRLRPAGRRQRDHRRQDGRPQRHEDPLADASSWPSA